MGPSSVVKGSGGIVEEDLPRAKYEEQPEAAGRPLTRFALAMIAANVFFLLKDMFFDKAALRADDEKQDEEFDIEPVEATANPGGPPAPPAASSDVSSSPSPGGSGASIEDFQASRLNLGLGPVAVFTQNDSFVPIRFDARGSSSPVRPLNAAVNDNGEIALPFALGDFGAFPFAGSSGGASGASSDEGSEAGDRPAEDNDETDGASGPGNAPGSGGPGNNGSGEDRVNRAPFLTGLVVLDAIYLNQALSLELGDFLVNAVDPDGDTLSIRNLTVSSGTIVSDGAGGIVYTPEDEAIGTVQFRYEVTDGLESVVQFALLEVNQLPGCEFIGTDGDDKIIGKPGDDVIDGLGGDDQIFGREGNDVIFAGDGDDRVAGGDGNDLIYGGDGDDVLLGEAGNDALFGEGGDDSLFGGDGMDALFGGDGNDRLFGEADNDTLFGEAGNDQLYGGAGNDFLDGGEGDDKLFGGDGNDLLFGREGDDEIDGGDGDDTIVATDGDGDDEIDGGDGIDTLDLSSVSAPATVDLQSGTVSGDTIGNDTVTGIENVTGSHFADTLIGDEIRNVLTGNGGSDQIFAGGGDDSIVATAGDGDDEIDGGEGTDTLDLSQTTADATIDLAAGTVSSDDVGEDTIASIENVIGSSGNDTFVANDEVNIFTGGAGDDVYVFRTVASAGYGQGSRDKISDFEIGDRIDLDDISNEFADRFEDALQDEGIRKFVLLAEGEAFTTPGEIRIRYEEFDGYNRTVVAGNIDFDDAAEFEIELYGRHMLSIDHFYYN